MLFKVRLKRRGGIRLSGRAKDTGCGRLARVSVAIARTLSRKKCSFLSSLRRFEKARSCKKPFFLTAKGTGKWTYRFKGKLAKGRYRVIVRATDAAGNRSRRQAATKRVR